MFNPQFIINKLETNRMEFQQVLSGLTKEEYTCGSRCRKNGACWKWFVIFIKQMVPIIHVGSVSERGMAAIAAVLHNRNYRNNI